MIGLDFLEKVDVFKSLNTDQLALIEKGCSEKIYQQRDKIFDEGDDARHLWVLMDGQVDLCFSLPGRISSELVPVTTISPNYSFGGSPAFIPPYQFTLSSYCATKTCSVCLIDREYLIKLFEDDFRMGYIIKLNLATLVSERLHQLQETTSLSPHAKVTVIVHMATCGIAAGARTVMTALVDELSKIDRKDVHIKSGGCIGKCPYEPNVTVDIEGADPVIYQKVTPERMRRIFKGHILGGHIQSEFVLENE